MGRAQGREVLRETLGGTPMMEGEDNVDDEDAGVDNENLIMRI